jgi:hypothetical protein
MVEVGSQRWAEEAHRLKWFADGGAGERSQVQPATAGRPLGTRQSSTAGRIGPDAIDQSAGGISEEILNDLTVLAKK